MTTSSILFAALRGALVLGVALAAMPLLRRASASTRRSVLVFAFAAVIVLPIATAVLPPLHLRDAAEPAATSELVSASAPESIVEATGMLETPSVTVVAQDVPIASAPSASWSPSPLAIVLALWALGALAVIARLGAGLYRAHRIAKNAQLVEVRRIDTGAESRIDIGADSRIEIAHSRVDADGADSRIDIAHSRVNTDGADSRIDAGADSRIDSGADARTRSRTVEIRSSAAIDTPAVTGLFRPVILLPRDADTWTDERRELVIAHELAHVARRDCLANVLAQIAVALHWFDPLAWIAARKLRIERELAADDRVLDGGATASSYAEHLLALALGQANGDQAHAGHGSRGHVRAARARAVPSGALAMAEPEQVSVRIRSLLAPGHSRAGLDRTRGVVLCAIGVLLAGVVACTTPEPAPRETTTNEKPGDDSASRAAPSRPVAAIPDAGALSTIDPAVQAIVDEESARLETDWGPCAAVVIVIDPASGNVLAISNRGGTEATAEIAGARPIVPGSTVKPLVIAAALEEGAIAATDRFDASPMPVSMYTPVIKDATPNGVLEVREILAVSSNVGLAKIFDKLGGAKLATWFGRFNFAAAPKTIEDGTRGAAFAIGAKLQATPLEIAGAYAMLANGGTYHMPTFVPRKDQAQRVLKPETANAVLAMLEGVTGDHGTGKAARVEGVRVGGKTGTAHLGQDENSNDYYSSFVGIAPLDAPRYVVFVGAETPREGGSGGKVAAPVFSRIVTRLLAR